MKYGISNDIYLPVKKHWPRSPILGFKGWQLESVASAKAVNMT